MKCPICKLENITETTYCDCGYNFMTQDGGTAKVPQSEKLIVFPIISSSLLVLSLVCIFMNWNPFGGGIAGLFLFWITMGIICVILIIQSIVSWVLYMGFVRSAERKFKRYLIGELLTLIIPILFTCFVLGFWFFSSLSNVTESNATDSYYYINYNSVQTKFIKLPPGSKWLFATPADVYSCDLDSKDCKIFFDNELKRMKKDKEIDDYSFIRSNLNDEITYISIKKYGREIAEIDIFSVQGDDRRFGILYKD